jgi:hypothetical protein
VRRIFRLAADDNGARPLSSREIAGPRCWLATINDLRTSVMETPLSVGMLRELIGAM